VLVQAMKNSPKLPTSLIFNIYKEEGPTSFDIIRKLKRIIPGKGFKIGHFGTLDPFATGVILVAYGHATRLTDYVHKLMPKTYIAKGILGQSTDTGDGEGKVLQEIELDSSLIDSWDKEKLTIFLREYFVKQEYWQRPPHFSAAKHCGKPLYKWARQGVAIEKPPVLRKIQEIQVLDYAPPYVTFSATVSTGTYIRTLFEDLAKQLGTIGHLQKLQRTAIGHIPMTHSLKEGFWQLSVENQVEKLKSTGLEMDQFLPFPRLTIFGETEQKYKNGIPFSLHANNVIVKQTPHQLEFEQNYWVYGENSQLLGLGQSCAETVKAVFNLPSLLDS